jgi:hypothetical protein
MRLSLRLAGSLASLALLAACATAETPRPAPPSPLRLIPKEADLLIEVHQPRRLVETVYGLEALKQLEVFPSYQELLASTPARRSRQLIAYFEKELGARWPELLDRLAGGGLALGVKVDPDPGPALLVVQGTDEVLVHKFARLGVEILEQELARQEDKERPVRGSYRGIETVSVGKEFHLAAAGSALLLSNNARTLQRALDLHLGQEKGSLAEVAAVREARRLLPADPLVNLWLKMENVRKGPVAAELYKTPRNDGTLTVLVGAYLDLLGRTPFVAAGLHQVPDGFLLTLRVPRGREGMGPEQGLHLAPAGQPGSLPLLEPKGVLYSDSFYLDQGRIWTDRAKLFPEKQVKRLEGFDKNSGRFLLGTRLSTLLTQAGPYHRLVVVRQQVGYKVQPKQRVPAFALVTDLRQPEAFAKAIEPILRGAAFFASFKVHLKLVEEKHAGCAIIGYRFKEDAPYPEDVNDVRFNFSPCFTRVGNQFVVCSTLELCRELVDLLQKEGRSPRPGSAATAHSQVYAAGLADLLDGVRDQIVTQTVLDQAVLPEDAARQAREFVALVRGLGNLSLAATFEPRQFHYDIRIGTKEKKWNHRDTEKTGRGEKE